MDTQKEWMDAGAWIGRQQAFAVIGSKCSAAQALALKQMKEARMHEQVGLTWDDFCQQHVGVSRAHVDNIIRQHNEFGDAYFRLSEIARMSPETYRQIAPQIDGDTIEIEGEKLAFTPANAAKIRGAVLGLRAQLRQARESAPLPTGEIAEWRSRQDALLRDIGRKAYRRPPEAEKQAIRELAQHAIARWQEILRETERNRE